MPVVVHHQGVAHLLRIEPRALGPEGAQADGDVEHPVHPRVDRQDRRPPFGEGDRGGAGDGGRGFAFGGDVIARSSQYLVGDEANLNAPVPGYAIVNVRASIDLIPGVALVGNVTNLFDRDYATFGTFSEVDEVELSEAPGASNPRAYGPGAPRRWTLGVQAKF